VRVSRALRWVTLAFGFLTAPPAAAASDDTTLVADGKSKYRIVLSSRAIPSEKRAGAELQSHLKQAPSCRSSPTTSRSRTGRFFVGRSRHTAALDVNLEAEALGNNRPFSRAEGFILRAVGPHLVIAGPGPRGTMYAVSALLEKLGVRWFTQKSSAYRNTGPSPYRKWCHTFEQLVPRSHFAQPPRVLPPHQGQAHWRLCPAVPQQPRRPADVGPEGPPVDEVRA
jgi:hypothetical protein